MTERKLGRNLSDLTRQTRLPTGWLDPPTGGPSLRSCPSRVFCITSGKGGTGKSVFTSNLSAALARRGKRVLAVDADLGLANLHLLLGVSPRRNIYHALSRNLPFQEIAVRGPEGVCLIPGPSGVAELADLSHRDLAYLVREIERLGSSFDLVLVDTAAGISRMTTAFLYAAPEIIVVTTPDLTAMTDAYATLKTTLRHNPETLVSVVVNRAGSSRQGWEVFRTLDGIAGRFIGRRLCYLGYLPDDDAVRRAVAAKVPAVLMEPESAVALQVAEMGRVLFPLEPTEASSEDRDDRFPREGMRG